MCFRVTSGLCDEFGSERVIDTPLTENGIIGAAVGMALYGMVPVPEIQFADFVWPAYEQIVKNSRSTATAPAANTPRAW